MQGTGFRYMVQTQQPRIKGEILLARARDAWVPAWPQKVRAILAMCGDRYVSAAKISTVILEDYGLTFRLFRLMNSAFFSVHRKDLVSIRYMVVLLGLENLAHAVSKAHVLRPVKRVSFTRDINLFFIARGVFASLLALHLAYEAKCDTEKTAIVAMFRNLGEVVASLVIPQIVLSSLKAGSPVIDEAKFKKSCGGYSPENLGFELARNWNMPELIRLAICPSRFNLETREDEEQRLFVLADLARELILQGLMKHKRSGNKRMRFTRKSLRDDYNLDDKTIDYAFSNAIMELYRKNGFFYKILDSQGLFDFILNSNETY